MRRSFAVDAVLAYFPRLERRAVVERLRQSTYVSLAHQYLYFEVPKAACSAMKELVSRIENCPLRPDVNFTSGDTHTRRDMIIHDRDRLTIPSLVDLDSNLQREVLESPDFLRLLIVRNPYSRLVSTWRSKVIVCEPGFEHIYRRVHGKLPGVSNKNYLSFAEFVNYIEHTDDFDICNPHWRRQISHSFFPSMNFNFIGKTEKVGEALARLQRQVGSQFSLAPSATTNSSPVLTDPMLGAALADRIFNLYRTDFETFGYDRNSWPEQAPASSMPVETVLDEIVERNLIIGALYEEIGRLRANQPAILSRAVRQFRNGVRRLLAIS